MGRLVLGNSLTDANKCVDTKDPEVIVIEKPIEIIKEKIVEVPVEVVKEKIIEVPIEVPKEVIKTVVEEKIVEVPVEVIKEVVKEKVVELPPKEIIVEVPVISDFDLKIKLKKLKMGLYLSFGLNVLFLLVYLLMR